MPVTATDARLFPWAVSFKGGEHVWLRVFGVGFNDLATAPILEIDGIVAQNLNWSGSASISSGEYVVPRLARSGILPIRVSHPNLTADYVNVNGVKSLDTVTRLYPCLSSTGSYNPPGGTDPKAAPVIMSGDSHSPSMYLGPNDQKSQFDFGHGVNDPAAGYYGSSSSAGFSAGQVGLGAYWRVGAFRTQPINGLRRFPAGTWKLHFVTDFDYGGRSNGDQIVIYVRHANGTRTIFYDSTPNAVPRTYIPGVGLPNWYKGLAVFSNVPEIVFDDNSQLCVEWWGRVYIDPVGTNEWSTQYFAGGTDISGYADFTIVPGGTPGPASYVELPYDLFIPVLQIDSITPSYGAPAGGNVITILGTGFEPASTVKFGGAIAVTTFVSSNELTCTVPAHVAGAVDVVVTAGIDSATLQGGYLYATAALTGIRPSHGPATGGTEVIITGALFAGVPTVLFGGVQATDVVLVTENSITCKAPTRATGPVDVSVTVNGLVSILPAGYTYDEVQTPRPLEVIPDVPLKETLSWLTNIHISDNGTEQRVAIRQTPRRSFEIKGRSTTKQQVQAVIDQLLRDQVKPLGIPMYQYAAPVQEAIAGVTQVFFDPKMTDLRDGDYALIASLISSEVVKIVAVGVASCTLQVATTNPVLTGSVIMPILSGIVESKPTMTRYNIDEVADTTVKAFSTVARALTRQGSGIVIPLVDGYPLLEKRPVAEANTFDSGSTLIDYDIGLVEVRAEWSHARYEGPRQYLVHRVQKPEDMDFWRAFLDMVKGRLEPFLTPSYRRDFEFVSSSDTTHIKIKGSRYSSHFFGFGTFDRLRLWTPTGAVNVKVTGVVLDVDGNDIVTFTPAVVGLATTQYVEMLLKVRLASDEVSLDHHGLDSYVGLAIRTVDE